MADKEPHVDFIAREGVTIYTGGSGAPHPPGATIRLPKSHADELDHLRAATAQAPAAALHPAAEDDAEE